MHQRQSGNIDMLSLCTFLATFLTFFISSEQLCAITAASSHEFEIFPITLFHHFSHSVLCFAVAVGPFLRIGALVGLLVVLSLPNVTGHELQDIPESRNELSGLLLPYYLLIKDSFAKKINNKQLVKSLAKQKFKSFIGKGIEKLCGNSPNNRMCEKVSPIPIYVCK